MDEATPKKSLSKEDLQEVSEAAARLARYACSLSNRQIQDGMMRLQFNREVSYYMQGIIKDVERGSKTPSDAIATIRREFRKLTTDPTKGKQALGVYTGWLQITAGAKTMRHGYAGAAAGSLLIAHGANNLYENAYNLKNDRSDTEGLVRKAYQKSANLFGKSDIAGNIAYGYVDLALTAYTLLALNKKEEARRLFRYIRSDFARGYKTASKSSLVVDGISSGITVESIHNEFKKE